MDTKPEHHTLIGEMRPEIQTSKYYNSDLAPVNPSQCNWGVFAFFSCWVAMNVCIPAYQMASSAISMGLSWWLALMLVFIGNSIILVPILLNSHAGIKYGIAFPIYARAVFGIRGAQVPVVFRSIIGAAWTGILIWVGAESLQVALELLFQPWHSFRYGQVVCFVIFWGLNMGFALGGSNFLKRFEGISTIMLAGFCLWLLMWGVKATSQAGYTAIDAITSLGISNDINVGQTVLVFIVANISFYSTWAINVSDISRFAKTPKSHHVGVALGLPFSMMLIALLGIYITGVSKLIFGVPMWNPNDIIRAIGSKWGALFAAIAILNETLNTNVVTNILPPANGFASLFPQKVKYKGGVLITGIIAVLIQPWKLVADPSGYIYDWLNTYGVLTGPLASILICDYFLIKKQALTLEDLYSGRGSIYWYYKGVNLRAISAWLIAVAPSIVGILIEPLKVLKEYGWLLSFGLGFVLYIMLSNIGPQKWRG